MDPRAFACLALANLIAGASYAATGRALAALTPLEVVFWRTLLGGALLAPGLAGLRGRRASGRAWACVACVGLLGLAAPLLLGTLGQSLAGSTDAALLAGFEPVGILVLSAAFLSEPLTWGRAGAVALGLGGSALIVLQGAAGAGPGGRARLLGDALLFLHGGLWAVYSVAGKRALEEIPPAAFTALTTLIALAPCAAAYALGAPRLPPRAAWGPLLILAVGVSWLATWLWNEGLERARASQVASFVFLQPVVGVVLGVTLQGERLSGWSAAGGAMVLLGVFAASRERRPAAAAAPAALEAA